MNLKITKLNTVNSLEELFTDDHAFNDENLNLDQDALRVLIVDDEINMQNSIGRIFQNKQFKTYYSDNIFKACQLMRMYRPDVVTLDLKLSGGHHGTELIKIKNKYFQNCLFIIISGDDINNLESAVNLGADLYLRKPFLKNDLEKVIEKFFTQTLKKSS